MRRAVKLGDRDMNMIINTTLLLLLVVVLSGCSGRDTTDDLNGIALVPELSGAVSEEDYPSNADLASSNGVPTLEQARDLVQGVWSETFEDAQCVTTLTIGENGVFSVTSLDRVASGLYEVSETDFGIDLTREYTSDNFQADCRGKVSDEDILTPQFTYFTLVNFPDRDTMEFRLGIYLPRFYALTRQ